MAASESSLGELHEMLASKLLLRIKSGEATAAEYAVAAKFLKDNAISCEPEKSDDLKDLKAQLASKRAPSKNDLKDAMRGLGDSLLN